MLFGLFKSLDEKVKEDKDMLVAKLKSSDVKSRPEDTVLLRRTK